MEYGYLYIHSASDKTLFDQETEQSSCTEFRLPLWLFGGFE